MVVGSEWIAFSWKEAVSGRLGGGGNIYSFIGFILLFNFYFILFCRDLVLAIFYGWLNMKDPNFERKKACETRRRSKRARAWHSLCDDLRATHNKGSPGTPLGSHPSHDKQTETQKPRPQTEKNGNKIIKIFTDEEVHIHWIHCACCCPCCVSGGWGLPGPGVCPQQAACCLEYSAQTVL